ncbi:hypothetical protein D3C78_1750930 [compost metagenome]
MRKYTNSFLELAHRSNSSHKKEILENEQCGCFNCEQIYLPTEINEWVNEKVGETAICPKCSIDSVLSSKFPIHDKVFLEEMNKYWF